MDRADGAAARRRVARGFAAEIAAAIVAEPDRRASSRNLAELSGPGAGGVALLVDVAVDAGDRRRVVRVAQHIEVARPQHLPQARCEHPGSRGRAGHGAAPTDRFVRTRATASVERRRSPCRAAPTPRRRAAPSSRPRCSRRATTFQPSSTCLRLLAPEEVDEDRTAIVRLATITNRITTTASFVARQAGLRDGGTGARPARMRFFGLSAERRTPVPSAFTGVNASIASIHFGIAACSPAFGRFRQLPEPEEEQEQTQEELAPTPRRRPRRNPSRRHPRRRATAR